jgi:non-canonical (house-cleaning) NTP pyrophosphatase
MKNFIITSEVKSTITMKEGFELTQEIIDLARGYNVYSCYMDNYTQMKEEEDKNNAILAKLEPLGVERIRRS